MRPQQKIVLTSSHYTHLSHDSDDDSDDHPAARSAFRDMFLWFIDSPIGMGAQLAPQACRFHVTRSPDSGKMLLSMGTLPFRPALYYNGVLDTLQSMVIGIPGNSDSIKPLWEAPRASVTVVYLLDSGSFFTRVSTLNWCCAIIRLGMNIWFAFLTF